MVMVAAASQAVCSAARRAAGSAGTPSASGCPASVAVASVSVTRSGEMKNIAPDARRSLARISVPSAPAPMSAGSPSAMTSAAWSLSLRISTERDGSSVA